MTGLPSHLSRRRVIAGTVALAACARTPAAASGDVLAAGQPAALLVWALAPSRLLGWPRRPSPAALALLPPGADKPELGALTSGGAPANLESLAALGPAVILDYGDTDAAYVTIARRVRERLGAPFHLIDGALRRTPAALRQAGAILGENGRATALAGMAQDILTRWRSASAPGPGFYYARGRDGLETGFRGSLATEVLEGAGWTNVATGAAAIGRVTREQVAAWDPEVVVTLDRDFALRAVRSPFWRERTGAGSRRLLLLPDLPFGWIDRPPSLNRLLGCAWAAEQAEPRRDPAALFRTTAAFLGLFYGARPDSRRLAALIPHWIE